MADTQGYNGWTNYETWCMNLWISNDEGSDAYAREITREVLADRDEEELHDDPLPARITVADRLKDWQEEDMPELPASVWSDLLNAGFSQVDWIEIAENLIADEDE